MLSVRTLRVRELCRHDRDISLVNNQVRNVYAHIGSYIFYEDLYRSNCTTTYVVPFVIGMLLARDSIVGIIIPSPISLPASLFTRSVMQHPATNDVPCITFEIPIEAAQRSPLASILDVPQLRIISIVGLLPLRMPAH